MAIIQAMPRAPQTRFFSLLFGFIAVLPAAIKGVSPAVGLNHLTLIPDSATFAAIAASPFLRDTFALADGSPDGGAERIALVGRSTYVEFRQPAAGARAWTGGLALGTDERGALSAVAKRLTSEVGPLQLDSVSRRRDSADIPWLYRLAMSEARSDSSLAVRIVEYHPQFARRWFGASTAAAASVARADVLAMHGAGRRAHFPFVDVVAIKVAAAAETSEMLVAHCRGVGWRVQPAADGVACVGPGVRMFVVPPRRDERGIVAFTMRVNPASKVRGSGPRTFGRSTLKVSKSGLATWEFRAPALP
ncbi:MAG: DUF5829 family protein [Gemmatimonadaceae bacterium]